MNSIIYAAVSVFILNMFVIAVAILIGTDWAATIALINFLVGVIVLLGGTLRASQEICISRRAVAYELTQIGELSASETSAPLSEAGGA